MRIKNYILGFICICLVFLGTACESESDKRKERIKQLDSEINQLKKETDLMKDYLDTCKKAEKC